MHISHSALFRFKRGNILERDLWHETKWFNSYKGINIVPGSYAFKPRRVGTAAFML